MYPILEPCLLPTDEKRRRSILIRAVVEGAYPDEEPPCLHYFELKSSEVFRKAQEMNNDGRNTCAGHKEHCWMLQDHSVLSLRPVD